MKEKIKKLIKQTSAYWFLLGVRESRRMATSDVYGQYQQTAYDKGRKIINKIIKIIKCFAKILTLNSI